MNERRARFAQEYLIDLNATQAAIRAGYSPKTAHSQGERLLRDVEVAAAIQAAKADRSGRTTLSQDKVLEEVAVLAHSCVTDYMVGQDGRLCPAPGRPDSVMRAVSSVKYRTLVGGITEVEFKLWDKPGTLRLAAQHLGMLEETVNLKGGAAVNIYLPDNTRG